MGNDSKLDSGAGAPAVADRAVVNGAGQAVSAVPASVPSAWLPFKCSIKAGRATNDPEKLVTPGILYASNRGSNVIVHLVAIGWWDWHVSLLFAFRCGAAQAIEARRAETLGSACESAVRQDAPETPALTTKEKPS